MGALDSFAIDWESPAQAFAIQTSSNGEDWQTVYATDVNSLYKSSGKLGGVKATQARILMTTPHPIYGKVNGRSAYGIRRAQFKANRLATIVEDCGAAGKSKDARDKYFLTYVSETDPCPSKQLREVAANVDAARTALQASTVKLSQQLATARSCHTSFLQSKNVELHASKATVVATHDDVEAARSMI